MDDTSFYVHTEQQLGEQLPTSWLLVRTKKGKIFEKGSLKTLCFGSCRTLIEFAYQYSITKIELHLSQAVLKYLKIEDEDSSDNGLTL